jgi:predicted Zn-dependent peptidase
MATFNQKTRAVTDFNDMHLNGHILQGAITSKSNPTEVSELDNGIKLVTRKIPGVSTTLSAFSVAYGDLHSRYQFDRPTAHFLEHMLFRETKKRSSRRLWSRIMTIATQFNGVTFDNCTMYYMRTVKDDAPKAVEVLSDMMMNSLLRGKTMEKEKGPIGQEYARYRDEPYWPAYERLEALLFRGHPAGRSTIFSEKEIKSIRRRDVVQAFTDHYTPDNAVVTLYGAVTSAAENAVRKYFGAMEGKQRGPKVPQARMRQEKVLEVMHKPDINQCQVVVGMKFEPINPISDLEKLVAMDVLTEIATDKLWARARTDKGWVYGIRAGIDPHSTYSYTSVWSGTSNRRLNSLTELIHNTLNELASGEITERQLARTKRLILRNAIANSELVEDGGHDLVLESTELMRPDLAERRPELLAGLTLDRIRAAAQENLNTEKSVTVLLRP